MFVPLLFYLWNDETPANAGGTTCFRVTPRMIGSNTLLTFIYLNGYGQPIDPRNPVVTLMYPDETILTATPLNIGQGLYSYLLTTPEIGIYCYTFDAL